MDSSTDSCCKCGAHVHNVKTCAGIDMETLETLEDPFDIPDDFINVDFVDIGDSIVKDSIVSPRPFGECVYVPPVHYTKRVYDAIIVFLALHGQPGEYLIRELHVTDPQGKSQGQGYNITYVTNYGNWICGAGVDQKRIGHEMSNLCQSDRNRGMSKVNWDYDGVRGGYVTIDTLKGKCVPLSDSDITKVQSMVFITKMRGGKFMTSVTCDDPRPSKVLPQIVELLA